MTYSSQGSAVLLHNGKTKVALTGLIIQIIKSVYYAFRCLCGTCASAPPFIRHPHPSVLPPTFIGRPGSSRCSGRIFYPAVHPLLRHQRLDMLCSSGARERGGYPGDDGELGWRRARRRAPAMRGEEACVGWGGEVSAWFRSGRVAWGLTYLPS